MNINDIFIIIIIILLILIIIKNYDPTYQFILDSLNSIFVKSPIYIENNYIIDKNEDPLPKKIYITHKNINDITETATNWKKLNPDYDIELFDNNLCLKYLQENYSDLECNIFNFIPDGPIKADFWRICVLLKNGGIYVDADIEPLVPLKDYIKSDIRFLSCLSGNLKIGSNPHIIMCYKDNPLIRLCYNTYIDYYLTKKKYSYWGWSIVFIFDHNMKLFFKNNIPTKEGIYFVEGKKYQFIQEKLNYHNTHEDHCVYNGIKVLNNRYSNYIDHKFV